MGKGLRALGIALACTAVILCGCDSFVSADTRVERAQRLLAAHDYRAAMIELKNALQSQSDHVEARLLLAQASLRTGDAVAADKELRYALQAGASFERTAALVAEVQLALGQAGDVLEKLDAGELPLGEPQRSRYRGQALLALREPERALAAFRTALSVDGADHQSRLGVAEAQALQGRIQEALQEIDAILEAEPQAGDALLARGTLFLKRGQLDEAEKSLQSARESGVAKLAVRQQAALFAAQGEVQLAKADLRAARDSVTQLAAIAPDAAITRLLSARIAVAEQDYTKAAAELQKAIAAAPDFAPARFLLGAVSLAQGNLGQAELHLTQALQRAPENLEARKLLAQVQLRLERPDAAMAALLPAVQGDGADSQVGALLGAAHLQLGDQTKGLELLRRSAADNPNNRGLKLELAAAYLRSGASAEAIKLVRNLEHVSGDARRERLLLAAVAAGQGIAAARDEARSLLAAHPDDAEVLSAAASFFAASGELERARTVLDHAVRTSPTDPTLVVSRARVELAAGDFVAGAQWLEKAVAVDPKNMPARMLLAEVALRRDDPGAATRWLDEACKLDASALEPRLQLARVHLRQRRNKEADDVLKEILAGAGGRAEIINAVGLIDLEAGRHPQALARFRTATDITPDEPAYWLNVARAQLALGHGAVAREALEKALALRTNWMPAVSTLAMVDVSEGKAAQALARVEELKKAAPRDAAVLVLEGDVQMARKQYAEAARAFEGAAALRPTAQAAMKAYQARQLGTLGDATAPLEHWLKTAPEDLAVRAVLAEAYRLAGLRARAIEQYEILASRGPLNVGVLNNLAWLYHEAKDARAEATASRAYAAAPNIPAVADTYGWILAQSGRAGEALPLLKEAVARAQGHPEIEYHYAAALAATGGAGEARKRLKALLGRPQTFASRAEAERLLERLPPS